RLQGDRRRARHSGEHREDAVASSAHRPSGAATGVPALTCHDVVEELSAFLDGELGPRDRAGVSSHLAACPACTEALEKLRGTTMLLRQTLRPLAAPADVIQRAQALGHVRTLTWGERLQRWFPTPAWPRFALAAALASVAAVAIYFGT